jgi:adenylate kinase
MNAPTIKTLLLTGKPGSGKGTQAKRLAAAFGWTHFSTGDRFRSLRDGTGPLAERVRESYDAGRLLPDWFADHLFGEVVLGMSGEQGIICEGYPRSLAQTALFHEAMEWLERPYAAVDLEVPDQVAAERMRARALVESRPDTATEEQIAGRLATYEEHTAPVLGWFRERGMLHEVDGTLPPEEVEATIRGILGA